MLDIYDFSEAQGHKHTVPPTSVAWTDVARWVDPVDGSRVDGVIIKATQGNAYVDRAFIENSIGAITIDKLLGWYHFADPDAIHESDPVVEARHFFSTVSSQGFDPRRHILALDIEQARHISKGPEFVSWVLAFCDELEVLASTVCFIYTGGPFFDEEMGSVDDATLARLARHPLWLAAYVMNPSKFLPKPWRDVGWVLHQDTGDVAPPGKRVRHSAGVGGGRANVDHSEFSGSLSDLAALAAGLCVDAPPATDPAPDPRLVPHFGFGSTLAEDIHEMVLPRPTERPPDTIPEGEAAKRRSSQRFPRVDAPIIDGKEGEK